MVVTSAIGHKEAHPSVDLFTADGALVARPSPASQSMAFIVLPLTEASTSAAPPPPSHKREHRHYIGTVVALVVGFSWHFLADPPIHR